MLGPLGAVDVEGVVIQVDDDGSRGMMMGSVGLGGGVDLVGYSVQWVVVVVEWPGHRNLAGWPAAINFIH